jgi:antitoxin ParD1/3/4
LSETYVFYMNVSLTSEMEQWVQQKVGSGLYTSASEVVREAIRALHAKETQSRAKLANLRDAIQEGIIGLEQQAGLEWTVKLSEDVKESGRQRRKA